ncbi:hypothetical protein [Kribbella sp. NPDC023855]|uniref:hypothetical protein n=1 Tax=Kribbella sp. NPDC023855 TaxID=3154698 RepID=UPI00340A3C35
MTDEVQGGMEWVPRFGMLEVPAERAALIRGLFELAAFVADHPELPVPDVKARFFGPFGRDDAETFVSARVVVDALAELLGVDQTEAVDGEIEAKGRMGAVEVLAIAYSPERKAHYRARMSYSDNVQPAAPMAGESR